MSEAAIIVEDLECRYGDVLAVAGISFEVLAGEFFGLLGPNGAGKTTTISMLTGIVRPTGGKVLVNGHDLSRHHQSEARREVGLVPQSLALYPTLTARDNLRFFGRIYGYRGVRLERRIKDVLEIVALEDRADQVIESYSGGMKRRLNLAVGLLNEPKVLFLDEPTVGVDPQSRNAIFEAIIRLNQAGLTVVYTTHYMEEAQRLCQRVAILDQGRVIALDSPAALCRMTGEGLFRAGIASGDLGALVEELRSAPSIKAVTVRDFVIEVETHILQEAVVYFVGASTRMGVSIASLNIFESSLETVFLKLTGKRLRDD